MAKGPSVFAASMLIEEVAGEYGRVVTEPDRDERPSTRDVAEAAERLGCSVGVVYGWIKTNKLDARRGTGKRLCIPWTEHIEAQCRDRIAESGHLNPAARRTKPRTRT